MQCDLQLGCCLYDIGLFEAHLLDLDVREWGVHVQWVLVQSVHGFEHQ